jgi:hypothetical protein
MTPATMKAALLPLAAALTECEEHGVEVISVRIAEEGVSLHVADSGPLGLTPDEIDLTAAYAHCTCVRDGVRWVWLTEANAEAA